MDVDPSITSAEDSVQLQEPGPSAPPQSSALPPELFQPVPEIPDFQSPPQKDPIRELCVKVHIRRSGKDSWTYLGRAFVTQEFIGQSSRVVVRSAASGKIMVQFSEGSDLQAEKRGNFVVISCVEGASVVSWSLNTMNSADTLRLLASIELACYRCRQALSDPKLHTKVRRRIERVIKDDRRRRHRRRRDEDAMVEAFGKTQLD
ncbi:uncharacterized protein FOMMEDRAFT_19325 [Fomitiporia mediterranea MF3/22]|uniref:uncharacterized protein n=1 Tax=Fomitiporia mediterranea (strain MF3/22) TaxID=694068 RepID=UPI0004408532|nr:uncharacterized protein FOMMEDRAFT_19325 [Fomitiporia mediterranea MF3/22]EJD04006.1 hypothetical protein FOMMEDRAFT_19325 [Fomitiporia mediterranea MF3/22]